MATFKPSLDDSSIQLPADEHEYKHNPPRLTIMRPIPKHHFSQELKGTHETIDFLPRVTVGFNKDALDEKSIFIKTTSVRNPFLNKSRACRQLTPFFDLSSRPIGGTLKSAMEIRVKLDDEEIDQLINDKSEVYINCFDYNTSKWSEYNIYDSIKNTDTLRNDKFISTGSSKINFFGKFCFTIKSPVQEFILTQVGTSHVIVNNDDHFCKITIKDDVIKGGPGRSVLLSTFNQKITKLQLKRAQESINFDKAVCDEIINLEFDPNCRDSSQVIDLEFIRKENDKKTILTLIQKNDSAWEVNQAHSVELPSGNSFKIAFLTLDSSENNFDERTLKKIQFFGSELEFVLNSGSVDLFIHRHKIEKNRIRCGFQECNNDNWELLAKTDEPVIMEELSHVQLAINNAHILTEDSSSKALIYFQKNRSGIEFFTYRNTESNGPVIISLATEDGITKNLKSVVSANFQITSDDMAQFTPYISDRVYEKKDCPEIYREYKLEWLNFLSPDERAKNRHINGL